MTRQKRELQNKIVQAHDFIACDSAFGCGFAPVDAYRDIYAQINVWEDELARLQGFIDAHEKMGYVMIQPAYFRQ